MSNNVWANSGQGPRQTSDIQSNATAEAPAAPAFNAQEVKELLKNAYKSGSPCLSYHPGPEAAHNTRRPAKLSNMANNKDFFLELRNQVLAMRQGGERAGG
ncbi:hypothetical protein N7G274_005863 [Stereocaulon virgatum]|uniref:Uncharacterized protein n=1 Tax=Stereocaulon virgatum TaxID=373712 RepID=A0ABR4A9B2_9LECA